MQRLWMLSDFSKVRVHWDEIGETLRLTASPPRDYTMQTFDFSSSCQASTPIHDHQYRYQGLLDVHAHAKSEFAHGRAVTISAAASSTISA
jgi:hypothetical protein